MAKGEVLALCQEMTISRAAFLRSLTIAIEPGTFEVDGETLRSSDPAHVWRIRLTPLAELRLGLIQLSRHRVEIFLTGYDATRTAGFLERFERYFRRAGG